mgnify:CR=1 FL=1
MKLTEAQFEKSYNLKSEAPKKKDDPAAPRRPVNKDGADCNEILLGYYCAGKKWSLFHDAKKVQEELKKYKEILDYHKPGEYENQDGRAQEQAKVALEWAAANKYKGKVTRVYWTARPGVLSKAVGYDVDSRKNPTDTLLRFGKNKFLGLSAKSTGQSSGDIGFKNPGIGKLADLSQRDLVNTAQKAMNSRSIKKLDFNDETGNGKRKAYLKKIGAYPLPRGSKTPTEAGMPYYKAGHKVLAAVRDELMDAYNDMSQEERKMHFIDDWLDAAGGLPYYIKVVGFGKKGRYTAKVVDPVYDEKTLVLSSSDVGFEPTGTSSILVTANGVGLFKIRAKWESAPLASTIKFSGDPLTGW